MSENQNQPNVLICIADGSEDLEAVTIIDVLRRTKKVNVRQRNASFLPTVGGKKQVTASRKTKIVGDETLEGVIKKKIKFAMICLPGGMPGATNLYNDKALYSLISSHLNIPGFILSAICAAPAVVLAQHGFVKGLECTCYPVEKFKSIVKKNEGIYLNESVVISSNDKSIIVSSQGPGTALTFSFVLVHLLFGFKVANNISTAMLTLYGTQYSDKINKIYAKLKK